MGDMGEFWRDMKGCFHQASQERRAKNREWSTNFLQAQGIEFEVKNQETHLIIRHAGRTADFWPGTGRFIIRQGGRFGTLPGNIHPNGRGVHVLLRQLRMLEKDRGGVPVIPPAPETRTAEEVGRAIAKVAEEMLAQPGPDFLTLKIQDRDGNVLVAFPYRGYERHPERLAFLPLHLDILPSRAGDPYWYRLLNRAGKMVVEGRAGEGYAVAFSLTTLNPDVPVQTPALCIQVPKP